MSKKAPQPLIGCEDKINRLSQVREFRSALSLEMIHRYEAAGFPDPRPLLGDVTPIRKKSGLSIVDVMWQPERVSTHEEAFMRGMVPLAMRECIRAADIRLYIDSDAMSDLRIVTEDFTPQEIFRAMAVPKIRLVQGLASPE